MQKKEKLKYHVKQKILKEPIYNRQEDETDAAWQAFVFGVIRQKMNAQTEPSARK